MIRVLAAVSGRMVEASTRLDEGTIDRHFPVRNSSPEPLIAELEKILDSGDGGLSQNVVKFQAIGRLNSILVVSQKPEYLKRAGTWIARLDKSDTQASNMKSYPLHYANSKLIVALLNDMLFGRGGGGSLDSASSQISPGSGVSVTSSGSGPIAPERMPTQASGAPPVAGRFTGGFTAQRSRRSQSRHHLRCAGFSRRPAGLRRQIDRRRYCAECPDHRRCHQQRRAGLRRSGIAAHRRADIRQIDRPQRQIAIEATIAR